MIAGLTLLAGLMLIACVALKLLTRRLPEDTDTLVEQIDALLPQTQCAQCGYAGCRPYAVAIVQGQAAIDQCPPGGEETYIALSHLLGRDEGEAPARPAPALVRIDETQCIGCFLCIEACPVDAIVGAPRQLHTVIEAECTGCELCIPVCPVDCIDLVHLPLPPARRRPPPLRDEQPCINCNECVPVCPADLTPQLLLRAVRSGRPNDSVRLGLNECVECGLCNRACPSDINLVQDFITARKSARDHARTEEIANRSKKRTDAHTIRMTQRAQVAQQARDARLASRRDPTSW